MSAEMIFNVILALVLLVFLVLGAQIPEMSNPADFVEAKGFPMVFAAIALLLLAWECVAQIRKKQADGVGAGKKTDPKQAAKVAVVVSMTVVYILTVKYAGFIILTVLFAFAVLYLLGSQKWLFNAVFSVAATAVLVLIFGRFFSVSLPRGAGILRTISFYLY